MSSSTSPSLLASFQLASIALFSVANGKVLELPVVFQNTYAVVEVSIGTPAASHMLHFDTGSSTAWLVDGTCADDCANASGFPRSGYNVSESSTGSSLGTYADIGYLGGDTAGFGVQDVFSFPAYPDFQWNQTFMAANESSFASLAADGFLGLAFSTIADAGAETVMETLMQDGMLDAHKFALYYGTEVGGNGSSQGVLTLGGSHEDVYVEGGAAAMTYITVDELSGEYELWRNNHFVGVKGSSTSADGTVTSKLTVPSSGNAWAVFDTGAGQISVPDSDVDAIYESIGMNYSAILNGQHVPSCSEFNSSWSVTFQFGDAEDPQEVTLTGDQLAQPGFAGGQQDKCWPPFQGQDTTGLYLFGTSFLFQFYSVFDFGSFAIDSYAPKVGFGQLKSEWKPTVQNST